MNTRKIIFLFVVLGFYSCFNKSSNREINKASVLPQTDESEVPEEQYDEPVQIDTSVTLSFLMGKFDPKKHPDFVSIAPSFATRKDLYLQKEAYSSFKKMHQAALNDGVNLKIMSATRSFNTQKWIWEAKWEGKKKNGGKFLPASLKNPVERSLTILKWSSMPGSSRHHWGTDIDLNSLNNSYFENGQGLKEYEWLQNNAGRFGFCQTYTKKGKERPEGYNEEKWHWSYTPLSKRYTKQVELRLKNEMIKGFKGSETAQQIDIVKKYILGVNQDCIH